MKKQKSKKLIFIIITLLLLFAILMYFYFASFNDKPQSNLNDNTRQTQVVKQTISKTISGSGEIISGLEEQLKLKDYRYLKEVYVEENQIVKKGEKLLKYTNGTYLVAPYDLVVKSVNVGEIGNVCYSNTHNIEVANVKNLKISLSINETEKSNLKEGQEVSIKANAFDNKTYTGKVKRIDAIGKYEANGSTFKIEIEFENDEQLSIGMSAFCEITIQKAENVLAIPVESVKSIGNEKYVTVVEENGTTKEVKVEIGISNDVYVEIKNGLVLGQKVQYHEISKQGNNASFGSSQSLMAKSIEF